MDYAKTAKLRFSVGDLDLPEREIYSSSWVGKEEGAQRCARGFAEESITHVEGACDLYKEEVDVLEEIRKIVECGMEKCGKLDSSEKTIAMLGD